MRVELCVTIAQCDSSECQGGDTIRDNRVTCDTGTRGQIGSADGNVTLEMTLPRAGTWDSGTRPALTCVILSIMLGTQDLKLGSLCPSPSDSISATKTSQRNFSLNVIFIYTSTLSQKCSVI